MGTIAVPVTALTTDAFAAYGVVIEKPTGPPDISRPTWTWWDEVAATPFDDRVQLGWLTVYRRPLVFDQMERHRRSTQAFIPLTTAPLILAVAPPTDPTDGALPEPAEIRAFWLAGRQGVQIDPAVWHISLFPLEASAEVLLVHRARTPHDDAEWADLSRIGVSCELDLRPLPSSLASLVPQDR
jgi:ureidoglycolate hydrolase